MTGWEDGGLEIEHVVEAAIQETGASSLAQMGLVIKTARRLGSGKFDEKKLSGVVRTRLQGMQ